MSADFEIDFSVDRSNKSITIKREFNAKISLVWAAFTIPEILDQWWAPKPWQSKTKFMNFAENGQRLYAMVGPDGEEHWGLTAYKIIQPKIFYTGLDSFCDNQGNINTAFPQSNWETKFTSFDSNKTLVEIKTTYTDLMQLDAIIQMGFKEGLTKAMEELDEIVETKKTRDI